MTQKNLAATCSIEPWVFHLRISVMNFAFYIQSTIGSVWGLFIIKRISASAMQCDLSDCMLNSAAVHYSADFVYVL